MPKFINKLADKRIVVVGGSSGIGFGAAEAFLEAGAKVTIVSSSKENVDNAVKRLEGIVEGVVGDVRDEDAFVALLQSLAPLDQIVFSGPDKLIRDKLDDLDMGKSKEQ